jgi:hypothetical protein
LTNQEARFDAPLFLQRSPWNTKYKYGACRLTCGTVQDGLAPETSMLLPLFLIFALSNQFDNWHNVYQTFFC